MPQLSSIAFKICKEYMPKAGVFFIQETGRKIEAYFLAKHIFLVSSFLCLCFIHFYSNLFVFAFI